MAAPFYNAIYVLFLLVILNRLLARRWPAAALSCAELLLIYGLVSVVSGFLSIDMVAVLISNVSYAHWSSSGRDW